MNCKRIVIIGPAFFNYLEAIQQEIKKSNIECKFIIERGSENLFNKVIFRSEILKYIFSFIINNRHRQIASECIDFRATHALFISPESMSAGLLKSLKENKIESCLYMWDGFDNKPAARRYVKNFIHSATFDPNDSENYEMRLINLFAEDIFFNKEKLNRSIDFSFVGTAHSIRPRFILRLIRKSENLKLNNLIHLYNGNIFYHFMGLIKTFFMNTKMFTNRSISKKRTAEYFKKSKYVLDITHPKQKGLTSRTFEAISSGAILVTNNKNAKRLLPNFRDRIVIFRDINSLEINKLKHVEKDFSKEQLYDLSLKRFCDEILYLVNN